ncbi:hypothetical protein CONLIGDRAFT_635359 [Coniochaeta ligniaria NRRL 30616]|uniref:Uncharacterized protein n=1 Tax=Coniochaeta ligniaria NRRL 30616 TaxID=1408157 RepID=A0A1J7IE23_9PEZI|nr:hypothetical protein CONLIGDRAFT_635359 [Coniochaeta ligniaria NRRL 30616]
MPCPILLGPILVTKVFIGIVRPKGTHLFGSQAEAEKAAGHLWASSSRATWNVCMPPGLFSKSLNVDYFGTNDEISDTGYFLDIKPKLCT